MNNCKNLQPYSLLRYVKEDLDWDVQFSQGFTKMLAQNRHISVKHAPRMVHTSIDASRSLLLKLLKRLSGSISADNSMFNMMTKV